MYAMHGHQPYLSTIRRSSPQHARHGQGFYMPRTGLAKTPFPVRTRAYTGQKGAGIHPIPDVGLPHDQRPILGHRNATQTDQKAMFAINWKTSWPLVETAIRDHNKAHVVGRRKDGRAIYDLKKVLRATHQHLLKEMIRLYSHQLTGLEWLHLTTELPPYRTHCGELATELDVSKGTVNNLLNRLLESGLVAERDHRGRCNKFALRFDPSILVIHPELHRRRQMALNGIPDNDTGYQAPWEEEGKTLQQSLEAGSFKKENKLSVRTGDKKEKAPIPKQDEASNPALGGLELASNARLLDGGKISPTVEKTANDTEMEVLEASTPPFQDAGKFSPKVEKTANDSESKGGKTSNPALGGKTGASDARLQDGQMQPKAHRGARRTAREIAGKTPIEKQGNWSYTSRGHNPFFFEGLKIVGERL